MLPVIVTSLSFWNASFVKTALSRLGISSHHSKLK